MLDDVAKDSELKALRKDMNAEFKAVRLKMATEFQAVRSEMDVRFGKVDSKLEAFDAKFELIYKEMKSLHKNTVISIAKFISGLVGLVAAVFIIAGFFMK